MADYTLLYVLVGIFVGITIIVNAYIFSYKTSYTPTYRGINNTNRLLPSSYVIATVWTVLVALMAYSQWLVYSKLSTQKTNQHIWKLYLIPFLFIYCVLYPFYTMGFRNKKIIDFANVFTIILSGFIAWSIYDITHFGSYMIFLTTIWSAFATFATFATFASNSKII